MVESLFHGALGNRLMKIIMNPPGQRNLLVGSTDTSRPIPCVNSLNLSVVPPPGRMLSGIEEVLTEVERVKRFGFRSGEIRRAKKVMLAESEEEYIARDQ